MSALPVIVRFKVLDADGQEFCWAESPEHALGLIQQDADGDCRFRFEPWYWKGGPVSRIEWPEYVAHCQEQGHEVLTYYRLPPERKPSR
jgi:hypothetical protein